MLRGADKRDFYISEQAEVALIFLRARCQELVRWLGKFQEPDLVKNMRDCSTKDIIVSLIPVEALRRGYSASLPIFLALLRLFTNCTLKGNVLSTGMLALNGYVTEVGNTVQKIKGALEHGVSLVLVPAKGQADIECQLSASEKARVRFVSTILDVLEHAVEGKCLVAACYHLVCFCLVSER